MNGDEETTRALARKVGGHSVERLNDGLRRILGEASSLSRLLLAMIFALNAGGFWFCFIVPGAIPAGRATALAALFGAGALVAILAVVVSLGLTVPVARAIGQAITHWTDVSVSGVVPDEALDHATRVKRMSRIWLGAPALVGLIALTLFVMATAIATNGFAAVRAAFAPAAEIQPQDARTENIAQPPAIVPKTVETEAVNSAQPTAAVPSQQRPAAPPARILVSPSPSANPTPRAAPTARPAAQPSPRPSPARPAASTSGPIVTPPPSPTPAAQPTPPGNP